MNGWELARELRETHALVPIVIISADGRELKQPPVEAAHHDDSLTKPVSLAALLACIARLLHIAWTSLEPEAPQAVHAAPHLTGDQLEKLRELAAIGYVSGLRTQLDVFEREAPESGAACARLRELLAEYRLDAFLSALDAAANAAQANTQGNVRSLVGGVR
jgi:DNA-binding response OmpR family regulator